MKFRSRLLWSCLLLTSIFQCAGNADEPDPMLVAAFRRKAESALNRGRGNFYAIALLKATYHAGEVERRSTRLVRVNGQILRDDAREVKTGEYCPEADFRVVEGTEAAVDVVLTHMTPLLRAPSKRGTKRPSGELPTPIGDWKLLGRFPDAVKAGESLEKAKAAFAAEPHWRPTDAK